MKFINMEIANNKPYEQMTKEEKEAVDKIVENYKIGNIGPSKYEILSVDYDTYGGKHIRSYKVASEHSVTSD